MPINIINPSLYPQFKYPHLILKKFQNNLNLETQEIKQINEILIKIQNRDHHINDTTIFVISGTPIQAKNNAYLKELNNKLSKSNQDKWQKIIQPYLINYELPAGHLGLLINWDKNNPNQPPNILYPFFKTYLNYKTWLNPNTKKIVNGVYNDHLYQYIEMATTLETEYLKLLKHNSNKRK